VITSSSGWALIEAKTLAGIPSPYTVQRKQKSFCCCELSQVHLDWHSWLTCPPTISSPWPWEHGRMECSFAGISEKEADTLPSLTRKTNYNPTTANRKFRCQEPSGMFIDYLL
jgi:hypothetical protein